MISYTEGNLLDANVEALTNTVNTVGVMGKGIALMFKERFSANMSAYADACKAKQVQTGKMFVTQTTELLGPKWIINFPTKQHWRSPSQMQWIIDGLTDLRHFLISNQVKSIAIPPLGAGNGGLPWPAVKQQIELALADLTDIDILIYQPTEHYLNVAKPQGVEILTPARAMMAEMVRRYWILGMECSLLEIQKLAWFLQRVIEKQQIDNPLKLTFNARHYGPYADNLRHLLNNLDGSYLKCDKRIADADPLDVIWFDDSKYEQLQTYLHTQAKQYLPVLMKTADIIDGFESPFGMELLSTVDWLLVRQGCQPQADAIIQSLYHWPAGKKWGQRKAKLFDHRTINLALERLIKTNISHPVNPIKQSYSS